MQWVVYLMCQSHAYHALAACSASAALRQPESRPRPSALGSIPSPAACQLAFKKYSIHEWHGAEEAQMAGGGRREEEEERRKKRGGRRQEEEDRRKKREGKREEDEERRKKRGGRRKEEQESRMKRQKGMV